MRRSRMDDRVVYAFQKQLSALADERDREEQARLKRLERAKQLVKQAEEKGREERRKALETKALLLSLNARLAERKKEEREALTPLAERPKLMKIKKEL